jgi:hypothetical protein
MAVIKVFERWQGRTGGTDEEGVRTLNRQWSVETDSASDGIPVVIDAVIAQDPTAALYASHPDWPWAVRREIDAAPNAGPKTWYVDAKYSTAPFEARGDGSGDGSESEPGGNNPSTPSASQANSVEADKRPPKITITRKEVTKVLEFNARSPGAVGDPVKVANTVGDRFDPMPEVFRSHHIISWKFHRTPDQLLWDRRSTWQDTINADAVRVFGRVYEPHSLRCIDYSLDTVWETGPTGLMLFIELTAQAEYNPDLWDVLILNTGRRKRIGGSVGDPDNPPRLVAIVDENGQPVADPVPLTAAGVPVEPGGVYHYVDADGYLEFDWLSSVDGKLTGPGGFLS